MTDGLGPVSIAADYKWPGLSPVGQPKPPSIAPSQHSLPFASLLLLQLSFSSSAPSKKLAQQMPTQSNVNAGDRQYFPLDFWFSECRFARENEEWPNFPTHKFGHLRNAAMDFRCVALLAFSNPD